jgi:hypothetical protein
MKRRSFLNAATTCLTAWGVSEILLGDCRSALAASGGRKLAVLIGVNDYPHASLRGCLTDVTLQEKLLIHRFGFQPQDIFKFTNQAATTAAVTQLFANELRQLRSQDFVVFHFSGKGGISLNQQPVLMMADGSTIAWEELARLLQTCPTRKILTVLDTAFQPSLRSMQGNLRSRAVKQDGVATLGDRWESLPGITIAPPTSFETDYADFSAGQLTYALTQALWQSSTVQLGNLVTADSVTGNKAERKAIETTLSQPIIPATIGTITNSGEVWLGGVPAHQIAAFDNQGTLRSATGQPLQILNRQGLTVKVKNTDAAIGSSLQEQIRVIPQNLPLAIAIDPSLPKLERVDAIAAFANVPNVTTKLVGEGAADYLLARVPQPNAVVASLPDTPVTDVLPSVSYGLFTTEQQPIRSATGLSGEAVKSMVKRFNPIVQSLYADKILALLENQTSSRMPVGMMVESQAKLVLRQGTPSSRLQNFQLPTIPVGSPLRHQFLAESVEPLYWLLVGWDSQNAMDILVPGVGMTDYAGIAHEPGGVVINYWVVSDRPFSKTLEHLAIDGSTTALLNVPQPLNTIQMIMQDLAVDEIDGNYRFDVDRYAVMRSQYQLV